MTITKSLLFSSLCALSITAAACKGDKAGDKPGDKGAAGAKVADDDTAAAPPPAKLVYKKLGSLPLEANIPDDAKIDDNSATAGFPSVTIWASPTNFVSGAGDESFAAQTFDKAKEEIQKDPNPFKQFTKAEATPDGWRLEYELSSMIDKTPVYGFKARFQVDGKPYECGSNVNSAAERDTIKAACTSIRKAK